MSTTWVEPRPQGSTGPKRQRPAGRAKLEYLVGFPTTEYLEWCQTRPTSQQNGEVPLCNVLEHSFSATPFHQQNGSVKLVPVRGDLDVSHFPFPNE
jgi:hypothetical protein